MTNQAVSHNTAPQARNGSNLRVKSNSLSPPKKLQNTVESMSPGDHAILRKGEVDTRGGVHAKHLSEATLPVTDFTEVFSWGSDRHGQLGLG